MPGIEDFLRAFTPLTKRLRGHGEFIDIWNIAGLKRSELRIWPEANAEHTDLDAVVADLLSGQYKNPIRVVGFNTAEEWAEDVSADVAHEIRRRCDQQMRDVPFFLQDFVDRHEGRYRDIQLPLPIRLV